jgi:hypothetical protein
LIFQFRYGAIKGFEKSVDWLIAKHGAENVLACTIHLDEKTPHLCAYVVPMHEGKLNARHFLGGREKLSKMQTDFANQMAEFGLQRGIEGSKATHTTVKEYYSKLNTPEKAISLPSVELSGIDLVRARLNPNEALKAAQEAFTASVTEQVKPIQAKSKAYDLTAKNEAQRNRALEVLRENSAQLRDIPLTEVAKAFEYQRRAKDSHDYDTPQGRVTLAFQEGKKGKCFNHDTGKGGGGAIDLVMIAEGVNYQEALRMLSDKFGSSAVISAAVEHTVTFAKNALNEQKPYISPAVVQENWPAVREYLLNVRRLAGEVVDKAYESGKVYADKFFNACFPTPSGCELRGTKGTFHGFRGSKSELWKLDGTGARIAFTESGIDALSLRQKGFEGTIYSSSGAAMKAVISTAKALHSQGKTIIAAFDNDTPGERYARELAQALPSIVERMRPVGKDWNEDLIDKKPRPPQLER